MRLYLPRSICFRNVFRFFGMFKNISYLKQYVPCRGQENLDEAELSISISIIKNID